MIGPLAATFLLLDNPTLKHLTRKDQRHCGKFIAAHDTPYAAGQHVPAIPDRSMLRPDITKYLTRPRTKTMVGPLSTNVQPHSCDSRRMTMIIELGTASKETKGTPGGSLEFWSSPVKKEPH